MSHISTIELEVKDLGILNQACSRMGLIFARNQAEFKWYGKKATCDHAIRVPGARYEIGIVKTGTAYELRCDFYDRNLVQAVGQNAGLLKQAYAVEKTKTEARKKGYRVMERRTDTGIRLHVQL